MAPMTSEDLRARVRSAYAELGLPSWPDTHDGLPTTREEEYSRITEPQRYRIVHARARVWAHCLGELPGVDIEQLAPGLLGGNRRDARFDRGVRIRSPRPDTLPLLLLEQDAPLAGDTDRLPVLYAAVQRPEIQFLEVPDCGCDACDCGSADLLEAIDEPITALVGGPFVVLLGDGWRAQWYPDGGASEGGADAPAPHTQLLRWCRRLAAGEHVALPKGTEALVGHSWLD